MNTRAVNVTALPYKVLKDVETVPINWLWKPYIPKAAITMIVGDGGYGKSWMTCAIAADLSKGRALPGQSPLPPQRVLIISAEDGIGQIIKPKMEVLNADMSRIAAFDEGFVLNPKMVERISLAVKEFDVAVVFLDPIVAYIGGGMDMNRANETRAVLTELDKLSKVHNIAVVGVHHVKKAGQAISQHRALGSVDFVNGVRSVVLVDITKTGQYFMSHVKSNWARKGPNIAYDFTGDAFQWGGTYEVDPLDTHELSHTPRGFARSFLVAQLRNGPVASTRLMDMAKLEGLTERTLNRAKKGVAHSVQRNGMWYWELCPNAEPKHPEQIGVTGQQLIDAMAQTQPTIQVSGPDDNDLDQLLQEAKERLNEHA